MHCFPLLLVDDHGNIRFTFRLAREPDGADVDTAGSVSELGSVDFLGKPLVRPPFHVLKPLTCSNPSTLLSPC